MQLNLSEVVTLLITSLAWYLKSSIVLYDTFANKN